LAGFGTRLAGYPGATEAANYLADRFRTIGLENVKLEDFIASVPLDEGGALTILDSPSTLPSLQPTVPLYSVWPNLVRTSTTPPEGITGKLYYVGEGDWVDFNDIDPTGAILMMDFNSGINWQNAANLGARAVIFAEPDRTTRIDGE
ncbi:MAG TPA: hypothetical protein DIT99_14685, partial [Candidatus Latescibacteria bacterium]|nr:hypothetical protein [Candidatus Latescibacterota bacterium]